MLGSEVYGSGLKIKAEPAGALGNAGARLELGAAGGAHRPRSIGQ